MNAGLGIRPELFENVFEQRPAFGFLEAHSENYFGDSITRERLRELREHYPLSLHGVGLSLGRADSLDKSHLTQLKALVDELNPMLVSEHLAWSAYSHTHLPDLLPLPLTEESLGIMCQHIDQMQTALGRQVLVENPSNYLLFDQLQIPEPEFLNTLAERTGCGLLVDINNIHVSATNLERDAKHYIEQLNSAAIGQYHLAGYTEVERHGELVLIDTHNQTVYPPVWSLFEYTLQQHGARPTLLEWDSDFPEFNVLLGECDKANQIVHETGAEQPDVVATADKHILTNKSETLKPVEHSLPQIQQQFLNKLLQLEEQLPEVVEPHQHRLWIYQNNVYAAIQDYLKELYPATCGVVGVDFFKQMARSYIQLHVPSQGNIHLYGAQFASVVNTFPALKELPYLVDLIHYEWALHNAYFASLANAIDPTVFSQEELMLAPVSFNESVNVIESNYPICEIHRQSLPDFNEPVSIDLKQSQDSILVFKREQAVVTRSLSEAEAEFLQSLAKSDNLLQVIEGLHGSISAETLTATLAMVFETQLLELNKH